VKLGVALLAAAAALLSGTITARGAVPEAPRVHDSVVAGAGMPRTLSEFGFFADAARQVPSPGVVPYELKVPLWSDGADKLRFIYLPEGTQLTADGEGLLRFPVGAAIIKTFAFGEGPQRRLIETRVLLHRADDWTALPYRWNAEQTEAALALAGGRLDLVTPAGAAISYAIPNKNQCKTCHSKDGQVIPIGPKARNLSPNWLGDLRRQGRLAGDIAAAGRLPDWRTHATGPAQPLARAYLDVNCAHCHQPGGGASNSGLDLRWEQTDPHAIGIMKRPVAAGRGAGGHDFSVLPGRPEASNLLYRMDSAEPGIAMPELGKSSIDHDGVAVVRRWIAEMK